MDAKFCLSQRTNKKRRKKCIIMNFNSRFLLIGIRMWLQKCMLKWIFFFVCLQSTLDGFKFRWLILILFSWGDITCQSPSSKHYHFKRQGYVGQSVLSALSQWHDTIHLQKKGSKGVFVECYCDKHLALTIWHSNIYWNDHVYWMVIDKWFQLKNLGLEDFFVAVSKYSEEN